ncbi:MAG: type II toxin-antitoxin system VapC family toxin [Microthrixaceae bacterium]
MATSAERFVVDTSVAVAALDAAHAAHEPCRSMVQELRPGLAGHAAFETYSVLTRMPGQLGIDGPTAQALIARVFPTVRWLDDDSCDSLLARVGTLGITGGAIYDAMVASVAVAHDCRLLTRDRRAIRTYDLLGVDHEFVGP